MWKNGTWYQLFLFHLKPPFILVMAISFKSILTLCLQVGLTSHLYFKVKSIYFKVYSTLLTERVPGKDTGWYN